MIVNDDWLFKDLKLERLAAVDSDVIRAIVSREGLTRKGVRTLSRLSGSAAVGAVSTSGPGKVLLLRSGSPLVVGWHKDQILWASEVGALYATCRTWEEIKGIHMQEARPDLKFTSMPDDTAWLLGDSGLEWHQEFKACSGYRTPSYVGTYTNWKERNRKWTRKSPESLEGTGEILVACPNEKCEEIVALNTNCPKCGYLVRWSN
jgi:hypothetical protein